MFTKLQSFLGFNLSASNIEVNASTKQVSDNRKRIDFLIMLAKNVTVSNELQNFNDVDLSSIYISKD